jgi:transposase
VTEEMENSVQEVIETTQTSEQVGPACTGWTRGAVMEYIYKTYGILYSLPWIGKLLKKRGFTPTETY